MKLPFTAACGLIVIGLAGSCGDGTRSLPYSDVPVLRLDTSEHSHAVVSSAVDNSRKFMATASRDKTVKLWSTENGRLINTFYLPVGTEEDSYVGESFAVAFTHSGSHIIVGGWLASGDTDERIYVIDRNTGKFDHIIEDVRFRVSSLAVSADGRYLAAGLIDTGIIVYDTSNWREVFSDVEFGATGDQTNNQGTADVNGLAFDSRGRLAAASYDGFVRLYGTGPDYRLIARYSSSVEARPYQIAFSPDAERLAVIDSNSPLLEILETRTLDLVHTAEVPDKERTDSLSTVKWSKNGSNLLASGYSGLCNSPMQIFAWSEGGMSREPHVTELESLQMIVGLDEIANNSVVHVTKRGEIGRTSIASGEQPARTQWVRKTALPNYDPVCNKQDVDVRIGVSFDGSRVAVQPTNANGKWIEFSIFDREANLTDAMPDDLASSEDSRAFEEEIDKTMSANENFTLQVQNSNGKHQLVGADFSVSLFTEDGKKIWRRPSSDSAARGSFSGNNHFAIVSVGHSMLQWYDLKTRGGDLLLSLYVNPVDVQQWIIWTPEGYFDASPTGSDLIGWVVNQGSDHAPVFYESSHYFETFYRPDIVANTLKLNSEAAAIAAVKADAHPSRTIVKEKQLPSAVIMSPGEGATLDQSATIAYRLSSPSGLPIESIAVLINGRARQVITDPSLLRIDTDLELSVDLPSGATSVGLSPSLTNLIGKVSSRSVTMSSKLHFEEPSEIKPRLFAMIVGISTYSSTSITDLDYADVDAIDVVAKLRDQTGRFYDTVQIFDGAALTNQTATRSRLLQGLEWLSEAPGENDVALLYIAGHGKTLRKPGQLPDDTPVGEYFFLPFGTDLEKLHETAIGSSDIQKFLVNSIARKLVFLDTCHSGAVEMNGVPQQVGRGTSGTAIYTSSTGTQLSQEMSVYGNGVFTEAFLRAMDGEAEYERDWLLANDELSLYLHKEVKRLTKGSQTPAFMQPVAVPSFSIAEVQ